MVHHIAATCHYETHVRHTFQHLCSSLDEVVGTLLEGDTAEECNDLLIYVTLCIVGLTLGETHCIVYSHNAISRNTILLDTDVTREVTYRDHTVSSHHTRTLDLIDARIDIIVRRTVERRSVHMHNQRLTRNTLCGDTCIVGHPVVSVNHVELTFEILCHLCCHHRIAGDLLEEVCAILAREGVSLFPYVAVLPRAATRLDILIVIRCKLLRGDVRHHIRVDMNKRDLTPQILGTLRRTELGLDIARIDHLHETLILITRCLRHHEDNLNVVLGQTASHTVAGCTQTTGDMGREFPTEH